MKPANLHKKLFGEAGPAALERTIREFPYYVPAHFFRLAKTPEGHPEYESVAARSSLYFNNPFLMNYRLQEAGGQITTTEMPAIPIPQKISLPLKEDLLFEPLHTTDYFASQGIKFTQEVKGDDRFSKQLRSFTDWLKTMKKLPDTKNPLDIPVDSSVEKMAEASNLEGEVLTESMAEVLVSQGKMSKAREVYEKLSLLYPDKIAYFANKIKHLKDN